MCFHFLITFKIKPIIKKKKIVALLLILYKKNTFILESTLQIMDKCTLFNKKINCRKQKLVASGGILKNILCYQNFIFKYLQNLKRLYIIIKRNYLYINSATD